MKINAANIVFVFFICIVYSAIFAADIIDLSQLNQTRQLTTHQTYSQAIITSALPLKADENLVLLKTVATKSGNNHYRYEQTYQGIPVYGHHILTEQDIHSSTIRFYGSLITGIAKDIGRNISKTKKIDAISLAHSFFSLQNKISANSLNTRYDSCRQVIFIDKEKKARVCYEVSFVAEHGIKKTISRPHYLIDVQTHAIVDYYDNIQFSQASGPGGNEKTGKYLYGTDSHPFLLVTENGLEGIMENENVVTVDLNHSTVGFTHTFSMPSNAYKSINGAYCPINDAHFFGSAVFAMYKSWYETSPISFKLRMGVHYGIEVENAYWDGKGMLFGDGKDLFYPLVCLDVVSHEVSHGFTEQNSNLIYTRQSGGINEAFSDIAGKAAEYFVRGSNTWNVGQDITKNATGLRFMDNPEQDGMSIGSAFSYHDEMDVHHSSGVFNKAFYLLASTNGWDTKKAFDVFVVANQAYWEPSSSFKQAAQGVYAAATSLNYNAQDVFDAFVKVDIDISKPDEPPAPPKNLSALPLGKSTINVDWDPGQNIDYYELYFYKTNDNQRFDTLKTKESQCILSGLVPQTSYSIYVKAYNTLGVSNQSQTISVSTLDAGDPPSPVQNLHYSWISENNVQLSWDRVVDATLYTLYISTMQDGQYFPLTNTPETSLVFEEYPLEETYYFKVSASNEHGESSLSPAIAVTGNNCKDPEITFLSNTTEVTVGETVTLCWFVNNAVKIKGSGALQGVAESDLIGFTVSKPLTHNSTFVLEAVNACGTIVKAQIGVTVIEYKQWAPYSWYSKDIVVLYKDHQYRCLRSHFSSPRMNPEASKNLWVAID